MTQRITNKMLEAQVDYLNKITGNPATAWTRTDNSFTANIGNYHISSAYGGVSLEQHVTEGGGVTSIFGYHMPKRELFYRIRAYIAGIEQGKKLNA